MTLVTCGIYGLWWLYDVMVDWNRHFEHNWRWEDGLAASRPVAAPCARRLSCSTTSSRSTSTRRCRTCGRCSGTAAPDRPQPRDVKTRIEILHPGDELGNGLVRHCYFPVPRWLLSGGVGQSWEWLTEVKLHESWRYDAIGKPLWSHATGWTRVEEIGEGRTRVHFTEEYEAYNPIMRVLFEKRVHEFISRDNDTILAALQGGIRYHQKRRARIADAE